MRTGLLPAGFDPSWEFRAVRPEGEARIFIVTLATGLCSSVHFQMQNHMLLHHFLILVLGLVFILVFP
jgi:hypothetical protein